MLPFVVFFCKALLPTATLDSPLVFKFKELTPIATLDVPVVLFNNAELPTAVFLDPVVAAPKAASVSYTHLRAHET